MPNKARGPIAFGPSRENATPISLPSNPPRALPFASDFIHAPRSSGVDLMTTTAADKALKDFFESALEPGTEEEEKEKEDEEVGEDAGKVEGLLVTLMKHQIEGLEFLLNHECEEETKGKVKGKHGGILADDVHSLRGS